MIEGLRGSNFFVSADTADVVAPVSELIAADNVQYEVDQGRIEVTIKLELLSSKAKNTIIQI